MVDDLYKTTNNFPDSEKWGLSNQMVRCAVSIPSNIAEGCGRKLNINFSRFVQITLGLAFELETLIIIGKNRGFLDKTYLIDIRKFTVHSKEIKFINQFIIMTLISNKN